MKATLMEILSIIINFILASGLVGTVLFFRSKKRKESAEADSAELKNTEQGYCYAGHVGGSEG